MKNKLTLQQLQLLTLESQRLKKFSFRNWKNALLNAMKHLGYVQIDTLS
ncbi:hypothetical protein MP478_02850 [Chryseobacterium sp. WG14]|nr:hypothetical protein [Chryseobacterium sp. WG14]MCQ9638313.1 hypothetical protein [Chryseobacterium sp. WG14]